MKKLIILLGVSTLFWCGGVIIQPNVLDHAYKVCDKNGGTDMVYVYGTVYTGRFSHYTAKCKNGFSTTVDKGDIL